MVVAAEDHGWAPRTTRPESQAGAGDISTMIPATALIGSEKSAVTDLVRGDVLIRDGRIGAVGENLPVGPDVEIVEASGTIVFPGLVDVHQQVWEGPFLLEFPERGIGSYFDEFIPSGPWTSPRNGCTTPPGRR
jgi:hypothetical protein